MNNGIPVNNSNVRYFRLCPKCSEPVVSDAEPEYVSDALCPTCEVEFWNKLEELESQQKQLMNWGEAPFVTYWGENEWHCK